MSTPDSHWAPPPECSTTAHDDLDDAQAKIRRLEGHVAKLEIDISGFKGVIYQRVDQIHALQDENRRLRAETESLRWALSTASISSSVQSHCDGREE